MILIKIYLATLGITETQIVSYAQGDQLRQYINQWHYVVNSLKNYGMCSPYVTHSDPNAYGRIFAKYQILVDDRMIDHMRGTAQIADANRSHLHRSYFSFDTKSTRLPLPLPLPLPLLYRM